MSEHLTSSSSLEHDNLAAQRAAAEAIEIGRATLSQTVQQGEQLTGAERVADETQYAVDRAGRILRGMTWSGWVANLISSDVTRPPTAVTDSSGGTSSSSTTSSSSWFPSLTPSSSSTAPPSRPTQREPPLVYENVPESCADAAQAVQNYHANLLIYLQCETWEQKETSQLICDDMHRVAEAKLQALLRCRASNASAASSEIAAFYPALAHDLQVLRKRQSQGSTNSALTAVEIEPKQSSPAAPETPLLSVESHPRSTASLTPAVSGGHTPPSGLGQAQDEHLSVLSQSLDELGSLASALNESILHQNGTMDRLHDKSDSILEQSQRVTRRAERMTQRVSGGWLVPSSLRRQRPAFVARVVIRHASNRSLFLGRVQGDVYLLSSAAGRGGTAASASSSAVTFLLYRRGMFVGLKHEATNTWFGQNVLGSLACTATAMGTRDEWQVDEGSLKMEEEGGNVDRSGDNDESWSSFTSTLLCASAGWGSGGYLHVRPRDQAVLIGGSTVEDKKRAALWTFESPAPADGQQR